MEENKYAQMTPEELSELLTQDSLSDEDREIISTEVIKSVGIKVAALTVLTTSRYLSMKKVIKAVIEEDGEIYKLELKKIGDTSPEKGTRPVDRDVSQSVAITIEEFE